MCATGLCANMTNVHFHGLHISPESPQEDVLTMTAMPGEALDYKVDVPPYAAPGLISKVR
jgi:suppressor of ftsI